MSLSTFIAFRYLRTRGRYHLFSRTTFFAMGGVSVGVMALIVALSVVNGFGHEVIERIVGFNTNVLVFLKNPETFSSLDSLAADLEAMPEVVATAPFMRSEALASYEVIPGRRNKFKGVIVKGIDLDREIRVTSLIDSIQPPLESFDSSLFEAPEDPHLPGIVLGIELANDLHVPPGDVITLYTASSVAALDQVEPRSEDFRVIGFFDSGMYDFDSRFVYIDLGEARRFFDFEAASWGLGVRIRDIYRASEVERAIQARLDFTEFGTNNWINMNQNLFNYMRLEKILLFITLALIVVVAAFNILSLLIRVVTEKQREIGVLRAMGASRPSIMGIFLVEGMVVGGLGTSLGLLLGFAACTALDAMKVGIPSDVYFIETIPVLMSASDFAWVTLGSLAICFLATLPPSRVAAGIVPVRAIREE
jgi:lipoprotein-releasing system permease protein